MGIYNYREREKREVDFIIENSAGNILGVKVKAGSAVSADSFKHLHCFRGNIARQLQFVGIVHTGEHVLAFVAGMLAVPINMLLA